jgi:hypothetical protein
MGVRASVCARCMADCYVTPQLITRFMKRMYTDKIIMVFTFLVACVIIGIIVMGVVKKHKPGGSDVVPPSNDTVRAFR